VVERFCDSETHWKQDDLSRLVEALAVAVTNHGQPMTGEQFDTRYPNVLPFFERRQRLIYLAAIPTGLVLGLAIALTIVLTT
jgi:hypothetical protein